MLRSADAVPKPVRPRVRPLVRPVLVVAGALVLAVTAWFLHHVRRPGPPVKRPVILIGDFENRTGEPGFDETLRELLSSSLEQSPYVSIFPRNRVEDVLHRMQRPPTQRIDESLGREVCQRAGLQALVTGSITRLGLVGQHGLALGGTIGSKAATFCG